MQIMPIPAKKPQSHIPNLKQVTLIIESQDNLPMSSDKQDLSRVGFGEQFPVITCDFSATVDKPSRGL